MTYFERIKAMSVEEMAKSLDTYFAFPACDFCVRGHTQNCDDIDCQDGIKQWLETEVAE